MAEAQAKDVPIKDTAASPATDPAVPTRGVENQANEASPDWNRLPSSDSAQKAEKLQVLDSDGNARSFKSVYTYPDASDRVLVIFVRHFFCGSCQDYLRLFSESITKDSLKGTPKSTDIAIIGCGAPGLINEYRDITGCPYSIYTDPTGQLFDALDMIQTWDRGEKQPEYEKRGLVGLFFNGMWSGLKNVPKGLGHKSGDPRQVGGEFLYESRDVVEGPENSGQEKSVVWCHRMRNTRDHTEIPDIKKVLGL